MDKHDSDEGKKVLYYWHQEAEKKKNTFRYLIRASLSSEILHYLDFQNFELKNFSVQSFFIFFNFKLLCLLIANTIQHVNCSLSVLYTLSPFYLISSIGDDISTKSLNVKININNICNLINHIKRAI
jgi:hypothetical protein